MSGIVIYTTPEILEHKKGVDGYEWYYWAMSRAPKHLEEGDDIFFAVSGFVVGSFKCEAFNPWDKEETITWHKDSWVSLSNPIAVIPFRGFRYVWW